MDAAPDLHRRLAEHPAIVFALLFGSRGRGAAGQRPANGYVVAASMPVAPVAGSETLG